ncbi:MAG: ABC transporter permease [Candidatus Dormibacteria bacterium]
MSNGQYSPRPGRAPLGQMLLAQTVMETRLLLLNGEQLLLTIIIPTLLLVVFSTVAIVDVGPGRRVEFVLPGILALAVLSTAFTGQAIATGFERRYGVLKRVGATPLPRAGFILAKVASILVSEVLQVCLLLAVAWGLGWHARGAFVSAIVLLLLGTGAFVGLGLLMAGTLRAEATLAGANMVFILLLLAGGVIVPLGRFPASVRPLLELLPIAALSSGLREVLQHGAALPSRQGLILVFWAVGSISLAARFFRWE